MPVDLPIKYENAQVKAAVERLQRALPIGGDMTPAFRSIGRVIVSGTKLRFRDEETPEGIAWMPSLRALDEGGKTLSLTRRLRNSYTYKADHASVEAGTNTVYAAIHHFGGAAGPRNRRIKLPARPALGASESDVAEIGGVVNDYLSTRWRGG
jgi:phage virion morphogenesis protein